jgi:hypothetical protein
VAPGARFCCSRCVICPISAPDPRIYNNHSPRYLGTYYRIQHVRQRLTEISTDPNFHKSALFAFTTGSSDIIVCSANTFCFCILTICVF